MAMGVLLPPSSVWKNVEASYYCEMLIRCSFHEYRYLKKCRRVPSSSISQFFYYRDSLSKTKTRNVTLWCVSVIIVVENPIGVTYSECWPLPLGIGLVTYVHTLSAESMTFSWYGSDKVPMKLSLVRYSFVVLILGYISVGSFNSTVDCWLCFLAIFLPVCIRRQFLLTS